MTPICPWPAPLACLVIRKPLRFWPRARKQAKTRQGPSFAQQKVFAPCLTCLVLSERGGVKEGEGGRPRREGVLRNGFRMAGWPARYERGCEPKTIGLNESTGTIACMTESWLHQSLPQVASIRGLARLRGELTASSLLTRRHNQKHPRFYIDLHMSARGVWHRRPSM